MLMSHRGRPTEGEASDEFTLQPVADRLSELLNTTVRLEKDWLDGIFCSRFSKDMDSRVVKVSDL
jgi:phosphoglycerate kinase